MRVADICIQPRVDGVDMDLVTPGTFVDPDVYSSAKTIETPGHSPFVRPIIEISTHKDDEKETTEVLQLEKDPSTTAIKSSMKDTLKLRRNFASNEKVVSFESAIKIKDLG